VETDLSIQAKGRGFFKSNLAPLEDIVKLRRARYSPGHRIGCPLNRISPLNQPGLFTYVNFLAAADKSYHRTPLRNALGEFDKMFRLGFTANKTGHISVLVQDLLGVEGSLGLVENQNVFGGN